MKDEEVQDFYIEKPKNILRILFSLFFAIVGVVIMFYSFINKDYVLMIPGTLFTVIFIMFLFTLIKVTASPDPYITLTDLCIF